MVDSDNAGALRRISRRIIAVETIPPRPRHEGGRCGRKGMGG
ncbi:hypothetical protein AGRO_0702 [Agrobacterium sp. ATCC 31749]|nr:hypothetical protein AGRO_0702 [Agrobacterium sp. ATCC 31749]